MCTVECRSIMKSIFCINLQSVIERRSAKQMNISLKKLAKKSVNFTAGMAKTNLSTTNLNMIKLKSPAEWQGIFYVIGNYSVMFL